MRADHFPGPIQRGIEALALRVIWPGLKWFAEPFLPTKLIQPKPIALPGAALADTDLVRKLRPLALNGRLVGTQREIAGRLGMNLPAFNRALRAAATARALHYSTDNNITDISLPQ